MHVDWEVRAKLYAFPVVVPPDQYVRGGAIVEGTFGDMVERFKQLVPAQASLALIGTDDKVWRSGEIRQLEGQRGYDV